MIISRAILIAIRYDRIEQIDTKFDVRNTNTPFDKDCRLENKIQIGTWNSA